LDGGDVLQVGRTIYVGLSSRSNPHAVAQLSELVRPFDYRVQALAVQGCLHLKSAATTLSDSLILLNSACVDRAEFRGVEILEIDPSEPCAANVLSLGDCVVMDAAAPRSCERLRARGIRVHTLDLSELAKAEAAVTCCSLVFAAD
jgi:dimethylargininase